MAKYIAHRLLMMLITLLGITLVSFVIINVAPGSPIEQKIQQIRFAGAGGEVSGNNNYGISDEVIEALKKQYGFDKPLHIRYLKWLKNFATFDFGESFSYEEPVIDVILQRIPISLQFGVVSLILTYLICIPLGIAKALKNNSSFDAITNFILFILYSTPPLMLGILLIVFFAGGSFFDWFPVGELVSDNYDSLSTWGKILDRIHHFVLPLICYIIGNFTVLTFLMKNSMLDELKKDYVRTARAKGLPETLVIYKHALRNALIPIVTSLGSFLTVFLAGSLIIEELFSIDGMGVLGYKAALSRDYNVLMGLIAISSLLALLGRLLSDIAYVIVDPRIDFS